jgi:hypothetical protein
MIHPDSRFLTPESASEASPVIHRTNAWNPTGRDLRQVPGCRLYYAHRPTLSGERTQVFLGDQHHLTFVADLEGVVPAEALRAAVIAGAGVYPHLVDLPNA